MENKTVKHPICINQTVFSKKAEVPLDIDFTLPDYCPDVMKILKCSIVPRVSSKSINGSSIMVDGYVSVIVMYCDNNGAMYSYEQISPYNKTFSADCDISAGFVFACVSKEYANCRAVSERRIDIHGALELLVSVTVRKKHEVVADIENCKVQTYRKSVPALNSLGITEKNLLIEEEPGISAANDPIEAILNYSACAVVSEVKIMKGKIAVKGELLIEIMYCTKGHSRYHTHKTSIPYSQFLDIEAVNEDCRIEAESEISFLEIRIKKGIDECRNFSVNAKICVRAKAYCDSLVPVICDAFSTKHDIELKKEQIKLENLLNTVNDTYMFKNSFEFADISVSDVLNYWVDITVASCKAENGKIIANANLCLCLLTSDENKNISYSERSCDFVYQSDFQLQTDKEISCEIKFNLISTSYTLVNENRIDFRAEYKVNVLLKEQSNESLLIDFLLKNDSGKQRKSNCSAVIYYPSEQEDLWAIAKRYNSDIEELKKINGLEGNTVKTGKILFIPVY